MDNLSVSFLFFIVFSPDNHVVPSNSSITPENGHQRTENVDRSERFTCAKPKRSVLSAHYRESALFVPQFIYRARGDLHWLSSPVLVIAVITEQGCNCGFRSSIIFSYSQGDVAMCHNERCWKRIKSQIIMFGPAMTMKDNKCYIVYIKLQGLHFSHIQSNYSTPLVLQLLCCCSCKCRLTVCALSQLV